MKDMQQKESIHDVVLKAFTSKKKLNEDQKSVILDEVANQAETLMKVMTYAGFLLDSVKKAKDDFAKEANQKAILVDKQTRMQE